MNPKPEPCGRSECNRGICQIIAKEHTNMTPEQLTYEQALNTAHATYTAWKQDHPDAVPIVRFHFPREVNVVADLKDALSTGIVEANQDAQEAIQAMNAALPENAGLTVNMMRAIFDTPENWA